jgi:fatty acid desaturase
MTEETRQKITDILTREELHALTRRSDLAGLYAVVSTWTVIAATLAVLAWASSLPLVYAIPIFVSGFAVIGGRHLALAILTHEAAHKTLFKTPWLNEVFADYACAKPIWSDIKKYRVHHFIHHSRTGQPDDTDLSLITGLPCSPASLRRKFARDLSGLTGLKLLLGRAMMDAGMIQWTVSNDVKWLPREDKRWWHHMTQLTVNLLPTLAVNSLILTVCWLAGHPWLFAAWFLSYITPFPLFLRIRSLAEHACTEPSTDMFRNTRTTKAGLLARITVAPFHVNYHVEHHVLASVPQHKLELLHNLLRARSAVPPPPTYAEVLRIVTGRRPSLAE